MKQINCKYTHQLVYLLPFLLFIGACTNKNPKKSQSLIKKATAIGVIKPILDQPEYTLELPGELKAFEEVILYSKVKGFVKRILVDRGSKVSKGQLLAVLEAPEISQQYLAARSDENKFHENYLYSRQAYNMLKKAAARVGAVSAIELDRARSIFRSDSAAFASVKAQTGASAQLQNYLKITAPFDGVVTAKNVSVGALVGDGSQTALFSLAQTENLRLTVAIPEKHGQSINNNTKVSFIVANHPEKVFHSKLSRKNGVLDQKSRSVTAEFDVENISAELGGGEYAQVKLHLKRAVPTMWLPVSSIVTAQSGTFVIKAINQIISRIPVSVGIRRAELQEVFGELNTEDQIVISGTEELTEGTKINIK
ncbi:efflux RND transporter periplasmic adaptor subunit [Arcticibacter eurypsychrophilus]|uniref:efflux RND transporter periplasmic adaptor subunit n=1 Tax=Arcticibacter eurypsychrophilus TaxID=1434752 RepID=UPI00084DDD37|nr:efflux RND transporter periplasmic adaptor subunit [Arcticibacter eurypsychrophilus]